MRLMGLAAIAPKPNTTKPHRSTRSIPYLLRGLAIDRPNQVWAADITYIPMRPRLSVPGGDHGLVLARRAVLAAVEHAGLRVLRRGARRGAGALRQPEIFNTDQGSQFTAPRFTGRLAGAASASAWTARAAGSTTSSSSGCGGR